MDETLHARTDDILDRYYRDQAELAGCQRSLPSVGRPGVDTGKILPGVENLSPSAGVVGQSSPVGGSGVGAEPPARRDIP